MKDLLARLALFVIAVLFVLPMLWIITAPFNAHATLAVSVGKPVLRNFSSVLQNDFAVRAFKNSILQSGSAMLVATVAATLAAYALSRTDLRIKGTLLYILILFSSVVSGIAAMVPLYILNLSLGLLDTHLGLVLVYVGGFLPTGIFIMKDFVDSMPRSYEEAALIDGGTPLQILKDIVFPQLRPGMAVIAVLIFVNTWGNFLMPFILLRSPAKEPAAVAIYSFFNEVGLPIIGPISAYALLYSLPVVALYIFVNKKFGFRFYGGIKG